MTTHFQIFEACDLTKLCATSKTTRYGGAGGYLAMIFDAHPKEGLCLHEFLSEVCCKMLLYASITTLIFEAKVKFHVKMP